MIPEHNTKGSSSASDDFVGDERISLQTYRWLWFGSAALILLIFSPSILFFATIGFVLGFFSLEFLHKKLKPFIIQQLGGSEQNYDPLLHPSPTRQTHVHTGSPNCEKDLHYQKPPFLEVSAATSSKNLKINAKVDGAIARFSSAVFKVFVSPVWAPYESRKELRLTLVHLLTHLLNQFKQTLFRTEEEREFFVRDKVLPLLYFHINNCQREFGISAEDNEEAHRRVLRLTRLLLKILPAEDRNCRVWQELCVSVLGDGVFWNLIFLAKREIPRLLGELLKKRQNGRRALPATSSHIDTAQAINGINGKPDVNFLLDSFLDPIHDVEQPSPIVSRHRPTLDYCLQQSDILYSLIHFLKTEGDLECLQAVLDESREPHKDTTMSVSKKILVWKHLCNFTRSKHFLENLGFSKIEPAFEVHPEALSVKSHQRSSSYGGGASGGIFDQNVIDGFAIYPLIHQPLKDIPSQSPNQSSPESESLFKRRHTLDPFIFKFYASLHPPRECHSSDSSPPPETKRVGVQPKIYDQSDITRILIEPSEDVLTPIIETVVPLMRKGSPYGSIVTGWASLFHPILNSKIETLIASQTRKLTSLESVLGFIDLITEAFLVSFNAKETAVEEVVADNREENGIWEWVLDSIFEREELLKLLSTNEERIGLFFVDLLDILVSSLLSHHNQSPLTSKSTVS